MEEQFDNQPQDETYPSESTPAEAGIETPAEEVANEEEVIAEPLEEIADEVE